jgi:hypothetical protein
MLQSWRMICVRNAMGRFGFSCKEGPSGSNVCMADDLSHRLYSYTLLFGHSVRLFLMIYCCILTGTLDALYTETGVIFLCISLNIHTGKRLE